MTHIVILGAGFGGLELSSRLSDELAGEVRVTLIDRNDGFTFGFSKLDVLFGGAEPADVRLLYRELAKPGVEFRQETITAIDPAARRVTTDGGAYDADILVVALGADYDIAATPGFAEGGYEYYSIAGAERLRDALPDVRRRDDPRSRSSASRSSARRRRSRARSCSHDHLVERGIREQSRSASSRRCPRRSRSRREVSQRFLDELAAREIEYMAQTSVASTRSGHEGSSARERRAAPVRPLHRRPDPPRPRSRRRVRARAEGWVAVDGDTLLTPFADVYAVGDVVAMPMAKAGVFAENAAGVVADGIAAGCAARSRRDATRATATVTSSSGAGASPRSRRTSSAARHRRREVVGPTEEFAGEKDEFAAVRRARWF